VQPTINTDSAVGSVSARPRSIVWPRTARFRSTARGALSSLIVVVALIAGVALAVWLRVPARDRRESMPTANGVAGVRKGGATALGSNSAAWNDRRGERLQ
jgi:hypothetical protein